MKEVSLGARIESDRKFRLLKERTAVRPDKKISKLFYSCSLGGIFEVLQLPL
jgi:hypothetical protein